MILDVPCPKVKSSQWRCQWLTVDTGGRRSELLSLDWRNVDLARGAVAFTKTKNGEDRSVRLTDRAKQVLMDLGPKKSDPVFTYRENPIKDVKMTFD